MSWRFGRGVGVGVPKSGGVTNDVDGVEKNIPEPPFSSLIFGLSLICNFSGLWNGLSFGVPKFKTLKLSVSPSSRPLLLIWLFCCCCNKTVENVVVVGRLVVLRVVLLVVLAVVGRWAGLTDDGKKLRGVFCTGGLPAGLGGGLGLNCC